MGVLDPYVVDQVKPEWDHVWIPNAAILPPSMVSGNAFKTVIVLLDLAEDQGGRWIVPVENSKVAAQMGYSARRLQRTLAELESKGFSRRIRDESDPYVGRLEILWRPPREAGVKLWDPARKGV